MKNSNKENVNHVNDDIRRRIIYSLDYLIIEAKKEKIGSIVNALEIAIKLMNDKDNLENILLSKVANDEDLLKQALLFIKILSYPKETQLKIIRELESIDIE